MRTRLLDIFSNITEFMVAISPIKSSQPRREQLLLAASLIVPPLCFIGLFFSNQILISLLLILLSGLIMGMSYWLRQSFNAQVEQELVSRTLETVVDIYWRWDLDSSTFSYRGLLPEILGYPLSANPDSAFWSQVIHPVDRPFQKYQLLRHLENESIPYHCEYRMRDHAGNYQWFVGKGQVVKRDQDGKAQLMVGSLEHIQARKDLEQNLIQAHKMEAIGQLTGGIAHDFNNVLGSILGYAELAAETSKDTTIKSYLGQISSSGNRAKHLVAQLLDFSRKTTVEPKPVNLASELQNAADMMRATLPKSISISEEYPSVPCIGFLDANQFQRVLLNLCINARDAIDTTGNLKLTLITGQERGIQCDSCQKKFSGNYHCLTIEDDGEGIDKQLVHRLFDPFFTTKAFGKGSGMGLAVVHGIVHEFLGHVQLQGETGKGTKVKVFIPLIQQKDNKLTLLANGGG